MASWLIPAIAGKDAPALYRLPPRGTPDQDVQIIADMIFSFLRIALGDRERDTEVLGLLFALLRVFRLDHEVLAAAVISDPPLFDQVRELRDPETYDRLAVYLGNLFPDLRGEEVAGEDSIRFRDILEHLSRRREP